MSLTTAWTRLTRRGAEDPALTTMDRWVTARATTADGVVTDLSLDLLLRPAAGSDRSAGSVDVGRTERHEHDALDAIEDATRRMIVDARVGDLPIAGDTADWLEGRTFAGFRIERALVTGAEVSVTPELRRLVTHGGSGSGAWT